jgi:hypothetical protein
MTRYFYIEKMQRFVYNSVTKDNLDSSGKLRRRWMACDDSSGDGNRCEEGSRRARPRPSRSAITIRMRALVRLLRAQIRLLEQALGEKTDMHPSAIEQLGSLRLTLQRLARGHRASRVGSET